MIHMKYLIIILLGLSVPLYSQQQHIDTLVVVYPLKYIEDTTTVVLYFKDLPPVRIQRRIRNILLNSRDGDVRLHEYVRRLARTRKED